MKNNSIGKRKCEDSNLDKTEGINKKERPKEKTLSKEEMNRLMHHIRFGKELFEPMGD